MKRSIKPLVYLDRFYKNFSCGAKNHPKSWKNDKRIASRATRRKLKADMRGEQNEDSDKD